MTAILILLFLSQARAHDLEGRVYCAQGGETRRLSDFGAATPAWSPNGEVICYVRHTDDVNVFHFISPAGESLQTVPLPILDYYHCSRYLHAVAEAQYGGDPVRATQWLEATLGAPVLRRGHRRGVGSANGPVPGGIRKTATPFSPCVLPYTMGSWTGSFSSTAIPLKITKP